MDKIDIAELKSIQLDILDDVVAFCKRNNLRYFLAYGTLLGAVRHGGYIPWDDDVDIHMPRTDYDRFLATYNNAAGMNVAVSRELDAKYRVAFAKVYRKGTIVKEEHFKPDVFGVYIDIFPLDGFVNKKQAHACGQLRRYMHVKNSLFLKQMSFSRKLRLAITKLILLPFSLGSLIARLKRVATEHSFDDSKMVFSSHSRLAGREVFPRAIFDGCKMVSFEGREYCAPLDCDLYLRTLYGNYMALPPEEKRVSIHNSQAWRV